MTRAGQAAADEGRLRSVAGARIVVTGGAGRIGRPTVDLLVDLGAEVTVLERPGAEAGSRCRHVTGDVTDAAVVAPLLLDADALVHLAGIPGLEESDPLTTYRTNTVGTFVTLMCAARAGLSKAVYGSSINASGLPLHPHPVLPSRFPYDESEQPDIGDWYSLSKAENEATAAMVHRRWGLPVTGLRLPLVRDITADNGAVFGRHIRDVMRTDPRRAVCEGWSYLDTSDAARAVVAALTRPTSPGRGILVAAPTTYLSVPTEEALDRTAPRVPREVIKGRDVPLDLTMARRVLGFQARVLLDDVAPHQLVSVTPGGAWDV